MAIGAQTVMYGCSENIEPGLYADSESHISLSVSAQGFNNGLLEIGSAQSSTTFTVSSTTRWNVEVTDCEGAWCQIAYGGEMSDHGSQIGDGSFSVDAAPNRSGNDRECNIVVYAIEIDGTHIPGRSVQIHLEQDRQSIKVDYAGDLISPYGTTASTEPIVTVTANQAWTASSSHSWVTIVAGSGMNGDGFVPEFGSSAETSVSFRISVEGNPGTSARNAEVTISSPTSAFTPIRLNVTQEGSSDTFFVTPTDVPLVSNGGGVVEFQVYSPRESWTVSAVSAGDWIALDRTSGEASTESVTIRAIVSANNEHAARQAGIVFTRSGGMGETVITVNQKGDPSVPEVPDPDFSPVVSDAWIVGGWSQTWAQLHAYYLSPSIELTGCGAFIHPVSDDSDESIRDCQGYLGENSSIIVDLEGLEPNTEYKAWGYVSYILYGETRITTGGATYFTTPDKNGQPGPDDNTPPVVGASSRKITIR